MFRSNFEKGVSIRDQLARMLGGAGFDPATDIFAITVNRWAHGYAYTPFGLDTPDWKKGRSPGSAAASDSDALPLLIQTPVRAPTPTPRSTKRFAPSANSSPNVANLKGGDAAAARELVLHALVAPRYLQTR